MFPPTASASAVLPMETVPGHYDLGEHLIYRLQGILTVSINRLQGILTTSAAVELLCARRTWIAAGGGPV
jgi:hypothetical protein